MNNTVWIYVYTDTIRSLDERETDNLSRILVTEEFAEQYYEDNVYFDGYDTFDDFMDYYIADDTTDFYEYAKAHNAIIKIEEV